MKTAPIAATCVMPNCSPNKNHAKIAVKNGAKFRTRFTCIAVISAIALLYKSCPMIVLKNISHPNIKTVFSEITGKPSTKYETMSKIPPPIINGIVVSVIVWIFFPRARYLPSVVCKANPSNPSIRIPNPFARNGIC